MPKWGIHRERPPVNVSARLDRFATAELESLAEHSLMNAGAAMDRWRRTSEAVDLDEAIVQTDQALQALRIVQQRSFI